MATDKEERAKRKKFGTELNWTIEKLIRERLGRLEEAVLLGNKIYTKPTAEETELHLKDKVIPQIKVRLAIEKNLEIGENVDLEIELENVEKSPVLLRRIQEIVPNGFEFVSSSGIYDPTNNHIDMQGKKLDPYVVENIRITLRATRKGIHIIAPKILCVSETGRSMSCKPEPASIEVSETVLPDRVKTGFKDLDNLLFGGLPENYSVLLTSDPCDERDLLVRRFLESGATKGETTFYVTKDAVGVRRLAEEFKSNFYVLICNPKLDKTLEKLPNVFRSSEVENLTEINIALESAFRRLSKLKNGPKRACLDIVSDVLLQHHAIQTRRWLTRLIPELRSNGFTTLAIIDPHMHFSEEMHAVLDLFDGEINMYEKEGQTNPIKHLRIKRMQGQRYLDSELPLRKARLMTTPATMPCCTRTPNL